LIPGIYPSDQQGNVFYMMGVGKHVQRLNFFHPVIRIQERHVTGLGGGITTDIDNPGRQRTGNRHDHIFMHA
jgi:hypothetical protein